MAVPRDSRRDRPLREWLQVDRQRLRHPESHQQGAGIQHGRARKEGALADVPSRPDAPRWAGEKALAPDYCFVSGTFGRVADPPAHDLEKLIETLRDRV